LAGVVNDIEKLAVGIFTVLAPLFAYSVTFLLSLSQALSLFAMVGLVLAELAATVCVLRKS
jgi:hypothetical protein